MFNALDVNKQKTVAEELDRTPSEVLTALVYFLISPFCVGLINCPKCGNCNEADETALHCLCYCSHYGAVRTRIWGKPFLHPSEVLHITVKDLLTFLTSSWRFS